MCGIVGCAGSIDRDLESVFKNLLWLDTLRGKDSTGIMSVNKAMTLVSTAKAVGPATDFLDPTVNNNLSFNYGPFNRVMQSQCNVLLGHNRAATRGEVTKANAHPFKHEHITGVHNGTLTNCSNLPDNKMFDVDSDNIFYSISEIGVKETLKKLEGAFALVWWNHKEKTLNFARNDQRPFHFMWTKNKRSIIWASEGEMLKFVTQRQEVGLYKENGVSLFFTKPLHHYKFKIESGQPVEITEVEKFEEAPKHYSPLHYGDPGNNRKRPTTPWWGRDYYEDKKKETKKENNVVPLQNFWKVIKTHKTTYLAFKKQVQSKTTISNLLKVGCSCCKKVVEFEEEKKELEAYFYDDHSYICGTCHDEAKENTHWNEYVK